ncbi:MAG: tRNA glutamyl-Q(34) synthetase GluQRS [SAR86 cluster bacterium]|uniref:Glutamyl-Q tRNA(Asp) synthetase n=1 Tax=SAR86 cluster bacterium TaxID=2030880 RepID=A0A2A4MGJ5_9GAMM|nr:MAG: tRNA glutamyl-Q(34) synthetase GluQRS [SAR86 cluster bacterium]
MPSNTRVVKNQGKYVGRFAPSPSGPLHFGSLLAATASFLDAKACDGLWLMRMEDLDPAREPAGVAQIILNQLLEFGLQWDGDVLYQSTRLAAYDSALKHLQAQGVCFQCDCSRPQIKAMGGTYNGACRSRLTPPVNDFAIRVLVNNEVLQFKDLIQADYQHSLGSDTGDFVIRRKDTLTAYQLAVVVDDAFQGINTVIRGIDLLDSTPRQIYLQQLLAYSSPVYGHIPIIVNNIGQKLSKQHFAAPLKSQHKLELLHRVIELLGQQPPAKNRLLSTGQQLDWAIDNWELGAIPKLATMPSNYSP